MTDRWNTPERIAPILVITAALSFSAWSLFYVARHFGAPLFVAVIVSTIFDGGAIHLANLAMRHTREGDSGFGPRFMVLILAGLSAWLNMFHASLGHYPADSRIFFAAPPVVAVIVYEFTVRFLYRRTLRNLGNIPAPMPKYGLLSWVLFPVRTLNANRTVVRYRGNVTTSIATGGILSGVTGAFGQLPRTSGQTPGMFGPNPQTFGELLPGTVPNSRDVREWARQAGLTRARTGPISAEIMARYLQAIASGQIPDDESGNPDEPGPRFEEFQPGPIPEIEQINGHDPIQPEEIESS